VETARQYAVAIGGVAALLLVYLVNPWLEPEGVLRQVVTVAFWALAIALVVILFRDSRQPDFQTVEIEGPAFARFLFGNPRAGLLWLPIRLFVGFEFLAAGLDKLNSTAWTSDGTALLGFWSHAVAVPASGSPAISFEWWRAFLQLLIDANAAPWFSWIVLMGETAVGLGLVFGCLTGIATFFGLTLNMSFMLSGSASINPVLFACGIGLILAWRVAGFYGIDRYLLPRLGTPWHRGSGSQPQPDRTNT
jgi:thiosulfate dehydrogenase [quinone] large subunit